MLEVPPDLTVTQGENQAKIPGESESTSLSEFERQRDQRLLRGNVVLGSGEYEDEQWLALQGTVAQVWPDLRQFWLGNGFQLELDDAELGVIETSWLEDEFSRSKFRVFAEPDQSGVILFLSSEREEQAEGQWLASSPDRELEKDLLRMINLHFYGDAPVASSSDLGLLDDLDSTNNFDDGSVSSASDISDPLTSSGPRAEILDLGEGRLYLAVPMEYTRAWRETQLVLEQAGFIVEASDPEKGIYDFYYFKPQDVEEDEEKGLLSRLKFWGDDEEDAEQGIPYQLSLTGVGNKTEVIVTNTDGDWLSSEDADSILSTLQDYYNRL